MQKIVELQRETYVAAKGAFLGRLHEKPCEPGSPEFVQQRIVFAGLANETARLFSDKAYCYAFDAVASLGALQVAALSESSSAAANGDESTRLALETMFRVRIALDQMAEEIGRLPDRRWWHIRHRKPRLGRREYDRPKGMNALVQLRDAPSRDKRRRESDKLWELAFGPRAAS
jgi:hypothetical protein